MKFTLFVSQTKMSLRPLMRTLGIHTHTTNNYQKAAGLNTYLINVHNLNNYASFSVLLDFANVTWVDLIQEPYINIQENNRISQPESRAPLKESSDNQHRDKINDIIQSKKTIFYY